MITFIDLGPIATVHLFLRVPVPMDGGGWAWGEMPGYAGTIAREFGYSALECTALVHTYGRTMGQLLQRLRQVDRYTITARGPLTGKVVGMREYQWSIADRAFLPVGEYLCGWRSAMRAYFDQTGELFDGQHFSPRGTLAQSACWVDGTPSPLAHAA